MSLKLKLLLFFFSTVSIHVHDQFCGGIEPDLAESKLPSNIHCRIQTFFALLNYLQLAMGSVLSFLAPQTCGVFLQVNYCKLKCLTSMERVFYAQDILNFVFGTCTYILVNGMASSVFLVSTQWRR